MKVKKYILMLFALLFLSPLLLRSVKIKIGKPLYELDDKISWPKVVWSEILDESFQKTVENSFRLDNGLSNFLVRAKNQLDYSLFNEANLYEVILGEKKHVYQEFYIDAYVGRDYKGDSYFSEQCKKLAYIQKRLKQKGKCFIFVLAPSKASVFPEYIPKRYLEGKMSGPTNERNFEKHCKLNAISLINFNEWFIQIKDTVTCPIFPQGEVHWSAYGSSLAADSILSYLRVHFSPNIAHPKHINLSYADTFPRMDNYIGDRMNLLFSQGYYNTAAPLIDWNTKGCYKPKLLTISDSFFLNMETTSFYSSCFDSSSVDLNQNNIKHSVFDESMYIHKDKINLKEEIRSHDLIMVLITVGNLSRGTWGFVDEAYALLQEEEKTKRNML